MFVSVASRIAALSAFALVSLSPAAAQETAPASDASDIIVFGQRTEEAVRNFVVAMSAPPLGPDQLARWDRSICPGVAGLRARYAQFLIDRMAQRAFDVGLHVGEPGCRANILIVVTPNPDGIARNLFDRRASALGYFSDRGEATRGRQELRETFLNSDAPVRWWHVSHTATATGQEITRVSATPCRGPMRPAGVHDIIQCYPTNLMGGGASRLRGPSRQDFGAAFIIVDANRLAEIEHDFNALADYVAMVGLAQLDPRADVSAYPSVLNLWRVADAPDTMTDWDVGYLRGLYESRREAVSVERQQGDITREMMRTAD